MCSSPICGEVISVPEGAVQVMCGECNTLHFISEADLMDLKPQIEQALDGEELTPNDMDLSELDLTPTPQKNNSYDSEGEDGVSPPLQEEIAEAEIGMTPTENVNEEPNSKPDLEVAYLVTNSGEYLPLKVGANIIGRSNVDLIISDKTVSRKHCVIEASADEASTMTFVIYDIGHTEGTPSTNGVYLSGRTLRLQDYERVPLKDGVTIEVGSVHLDFLIKPKDIPD